MTPKERREARIKLARHKARVARAQEKAKTQATAKPVVHVQPKFKGWNVFCFATGPSLTEEQVRLVEPLHAAKKVLAFGLNDAYRIVPYLDVLYACDPKWWDVHMEQEDHKQYGLAEYPAEQWTQDSGVPKKYPNVNRIPGAGKKGFGEKTIHFGSNSGFQLLNLAYLMGVEKMFLLGYDMGAGGDNVEQHFFGPHPKPLSRGRHYASFSKHFETIQPEIRQRIINCTPTTNLKAFARRDLAEVVHELRHG